MAALLPFLAVMIVSLHSADTDSITIGTLDETIFNVLLEGGSSSQELFLEETGLYLLPQNVPVKGRVLEICTYGYVAEEFFATIARSNSTRPFVLVILYRLSDEEREYQAVYKPAVVFHDGLPKCLSSGDGLDWLVEEGDRIGIFVPSYCIEINEKNFYNFTVSEELWAFQTLCPSQVNFISGMEDYSAPFSNVSLNFKEIQHFSFRLDEQFNSTAVRINLEVTILPGG